MEIKNLFDDKFEFLQRSVQLILVSKFGERLAPKKLKYFCTFFINDLEGVGHLSQQSLSRLQSLLDNSDLEVSDISNYIGILSREGFIQYDKSTKKIRFSKEFKNIRVIDGKLKLDVKIQYKQA